jgi:hypothetical protein
MKTPPPPTRHSHVRRSAEYVEDVYDGIVCLVDYIEVATKTAEKANLPGKVQQLKQLLSKVKPLESEAEVIFNDQVEIDQAYEAIEQAGYSAPD